MIGGGRGPILVLSEYAPYFRPPRHIPDVNFVFRPEHKARIRQKSPGGKHQRRQGESDFPYTTLSLHLPIPSEVFLRS